MTQCVKQKQTDTDAKERDFPSGRNAGDNGGATIIVIGGGGTDGGGGCGG